MSHQQRIKDELVAAGFTKYALLKSESRRLPTIIHENEHIMAAVYGRTQTGSAMLVATDLRVIFLDIKPLFKIMDEINYDMISGITHDEQAGFGHIIVHSRMGDYKIRYANPACASRFASHIENARIDLPHTVNSPQPTATIAAQTYNSKPQAIITSDELAFLQNHELGVLATVNPNQEPHLSTVYYTVNDTGILHILTKSETEKSRNIAHNHNTAFIVYDESNLQSLQLHARAEIEPDATIRQSVYNLISRERTYGNNIKKPPVTKLQDGSFTVIRLTPVEITLSSYS